MKLLFLLALLASSTYALQPSYTMQFTFSKQGATVPAKINRTPSSTISFGVQTPRDVATGQASGTIHTHYVFFHTYFIIIITRKYA